MSNVRYTSACFALKFAISVGLSAFSCGIKSLSTHLLQCFSAVQGLITKHLHSFSTSLPLHAGECSYSIFQALAQSQLQPSSLGLSLMFMGTAGVQKVLLVLLQKSIEWFLSVAKLICHSSNWFFMSPLFVLDLGVIYPHIWPTQPISHVYGRVGKMK